jgi:hypothetical protein
LFLTSAAMRADTSSATTRPDDPTRAAAGMAE